MKTTRHFPSRLLPAASALVMAAALSLGFPSAALAEEEAGPAFSPPASKEAAQEIGPGVTGPARSTEIVVVLDPGHGKYNGGYSGATFNYNGVQYYEDVMTAKISNYTKQYLEQHTNYKVYLTKDTAETFLTLDQRASFAASVGADLFVSQHIDAAGASGSTTSAHGVESMVPRTGRYRSELAQQSQEAAATILNHLSGLGLYNRGFALKDSQDGSTYPDGSTADYYGIPRLSLAYGIRGFIIEHGFINNPSDMANFLSTEENYKALGEADARGIIEYLERAGKAPDYSSASSGQTTEVQAPSGTDGASSGPGDATPVPEPAPIESEAPTGQNPDNVQPGAAPQ